MKFHKSVDILIIIWAYSNNIKEGMCFKDEIPKGLRSILENNKIIGSQMKEVYGIIAVNEY